MTLWQFSQKKYTKNCKLSLIACQQVHPLTKSLAIEKESTLCLMNTLYISSKCQYLYILEDFIYFTLNKTQIVSSARIEIKNKRLKLPKI